MCTEFAHKPQAISHLERYLGPIILSGILSISHYEHFLLLHVALYCLNFVHLYQIHKDYAHQLVLHFVEEATALYGNKFVVYDVHSLSHICDNVHKFGHLNSITAFPYENHTRQIKQSVRNVVNPPT